MIKKLFLSITLALLTLSLSAQEITGSWSGTLDVMGNKLKLVFNIEQTDSGYKATMDSPDQGAYGVPCDAVSYADNQLTIEIKAIQGKYEGQLKEDKLAGKFTQMGMNFTLDLEKVSEEVVKPNRPQEPQEPYPYYTEDLTFENKKEGITLAGTLTLPSEKGKHPVVVLISGSGAQDRNEELMGHKPFLIIADHLTRNGIGVLRFDDRGTAESGGNFETATTENFANDVEAAVEYLRRRKDINRKKIGLIGHSEGGVIAPMVALRNKHVSYIVMLAGSGVRGDRLLMMQTRALSEAMGMPEETANVAVNINREPYNIILNSQEGDDLKALISDYFDNHAQENELMAMMPKEALEQVKNAAIEQMATPWFQYFIKYDPAEALRQLKTPVLALNGSLDLQVPPKANLAAIETSLKQANNKNYKIIELEGLNHLFQEATTGLPAEYGQIEQTFSPKALEVMLEWLKGVI